MQRQNSKNYIFAQNDDLICIGCTKLDNPNASCDDGALLCHFWKGAVGRLDAWIDMSVVWNEHNHI